MKAISTDRNCLNVDNMHKEVRGHILERRLWVVKKQALIPVLSNNEAQSVAGGSTGTWRHQSCGGILYHWRSWCAVSVSVNRPTGGVSGYLRDTHEMNRIRGMDRDFLTGLTAHAVTTLGLWRKPTEESPRLREDQRHAQTALCSQNPQFYHHRLFSFEGLQTKTKQRVELGRANMTERTETHRTWNHVLFLLCSITRGGL